MATAVVIFGIAYALIATGRIPIVLIASLGAMAMVFLGVITEHQALSYVDLEVILLLAGMMSLAEMIGRTGVFDWAALKSAQMVRGSGFGTLCLMSTLTAVASALLDNVTVVVLAVPITLSICRTLDVRPTPFLLAQVFASNIGGASTIVADPPNIIIATAANIGFVDFMLNVAPVSVISMGVLLAVLYVWFRNEVVTTPESRRSVMGQDAGSAIKDRGLLVKSCAVFALTMAGFLAHGALNVSVAFIALSGASVLVLISRLDPHDVVQHVEWTTLVFFAGLFLLVWLGGVTSAVVDNIPFTAVMAEVVGGFSAGGSHGTSPLWWALALGADLSGNATIVGASANVIAVSLARASGYPISFMRFFKYGAVISVPTLTVSTAYLWVRYYS